MSEAKTMNLPVRLNEQELIIKGNELSCLVQELSDTEAQKKVANQGFKEVLDRTQEQVDKLAKIVREKKEYREVEVQDIKNTERMTMDTIRLDTGEVVSYRELKGHERNLGLFPVEAEKVN